MANAEEGTIRAGLLELLGMLYAVVLGLVATTVISDIIGAEKKTIWEKTISLLFVLETFYFILWDWVHTRILIARNPYTNYRRFSLDLMIALAAYGIAFEGAKSRTYAFLYAAAVLALRILWALEAEREYPNSADKFEFLIMQYGFASGAAALLLVFINRYPLLNISGWNVAAVFAYGYLYIFLYEAALLETRAPGIAGGPGVPFLTSEQVRRLRDFYQRITGIRR